MNKASELEKLFQLKQEWDSEDDDFAKDFYAPCLKYASFYRGESGFFTDSVLVGYSEIALELVERNDYKVELLTSPNIKERMRVTLEDTLSKEEKKKMLIEIPITTKTGKTRKLGKVLSERIYDYIFYS